MMATRRRTHGDSIVFPDAASLHVATAKSQDAITRGWIALTTSPLNDDNTSMAICSALTGPAAQWCGLSTVRSGR